MNKDGSFPPQHDWGMTDAHGVSERHLRQAWDDMPDLKGRTGYQALLGKPTWRERLVAAFRRGAAFPAPLWAGAAAVLAVVVLAGGWSYSALSPDYETRIAQVRQLTLADGTSVTLGARSAMDVHFTRDERTVRLSGGEAFFTVTSDAARPFIVQAGDKEVRVVGTRFNVNYDGQRVHVGVEEGIVDVMQPAPARTFPVTGEGRAPADVVRLVAGQQLVAQNARALGAVQSLAGARPGGWRSGRLDYQDALLADIVADARRYYPHDIIIASPSLAGERLTTSFRTSQVREMLDSLPRILPVTVRHTANGGVELLRKDGAGQ